MLIKLLFSVWHLKKYIKNWGLEICLAKILGAKKGSDVLVASSAIKILLWVFPVLFDCICVNYIGFKGSWWCYVTIGNGIVFIMYGLFVLLITSNKGVKSYLLNKKLISFNERSTKETLRYLKLCLSIAMVVYFLIGLYINSPLGLMSLVFPIFYIISYFKSKLVVLKS